MPGRRTPRRPPGSGPAQQAYAAFPGGMDGASLVPAPVADDGGAGMRRGGGKKLLFRQDSFTGSGSTTAFQLTYRPLPYSERVFLDGRYCRQGTTGGAWARTDATGSKTATVGFAAAPAAGQRVDVEYAYYEQVVAAAEKCGPTFPDAVVRGAASMPALHVVGVPGIPIWYYLPMAENFPGSDVTEYTKEGEFLAVMMAVNSGNGSTVVEAGPPLSSSSQYSRVLRASSDVALPFSVRTDVHLGGARQARYSQGSIVGMSVLYQVEGSAMDIFGGQSFSFNRQDSWAHRPAGSEEGYESEDIDTGLYWDKTSAGGPGAWIVAAGAEYLGDYIPGESEWTIPAGLFGDPLAPGLHSIYLSVDIAAKTITARFDGAEFTTPSSAAVWPTEEMIADEISDWPSEPGKRFCWLQLSDAHRLTFDEFRIFDDVPLCVW